jgi:hypothetical protein
MKFTAFRENGTIQSPQFRPQISETKRSSLPSFSQMTPEMSVHRVSVCPDGKGLPRTVTMDEQVLRIYRSFPSVLFIIATGMTGKGKSTRLDHLIRGFKTELDPNDPFKCDGGNQGCTRDFWSSTPILFSEFCRRWRIEMPAGSIDYPLVFIDAEGFDNASDETSDWVQRAVAVFSSIASVRICVTRERLTGTEVQNVVDGIKLNCITSSGALSSAVVVLSGEVGVSGSCETFEEFELKRKAQDKEATELFRSTMLDQHIILDNFAAFMQPQWYGRHARQDSYWISMQEAATFMANVVARTTPTSFSVLESIFAQTADEVSKMTEFTKQVDVSIILRRILSGYADKMKNQVIDTACVQIRRQVQTLDFFGVFASKSISDKFILAARHDFEVQCNAYYQRLLVEIPDEASTCQVHISKAISDFVTGELIDRLRTTILPIVTIIKRYRIARQYPICVLVAVKTTFQKEIEACRARIVNIEREIGVLNTTELVLIWQDDWKESNGFHPTHCCSFNTGGIPIAYVDEDLWSGTHCTWKNLSGSVFKASYEADFWVNCIGHIKIYVRKQDQHRAKLAQLRADKDRISAEITGTWNQKIVKVDTIMAFVNRCTDSYQSAATRLPLDRLCAGSPSEDLVERTFQDLVEHAGCVRNSPVPATPANFNLESAHANIHSVE